MRCPFDVKQGNNLVVKECSLGDGRVWLSVEAADFGFWLEIHVPIQPRAWVALEI